jgi:hypothetical protein
METTASSVRNRRNKQGFGYGDGDGDGFGDGFAGFGGGFGFGGGVVGRVGKYEVVHLVPWPYVTVDCKMHSIAH